MNIINISVTGCYTDAPLPLGIQGESGVTQVLIDYSAWAAEFGSGQFFILVSRPDGCFPYSPELTFDGSVAIWTVSNVDTAAYGTGKVQFVFRADGTEKRHTCLNFMVDRSLDGPGKTPNPYEKLALTVATLAREAQQDAATAEAAAQAIQDMGVEAAELPPGSTCTVTKVVNPETGAVTLLFAFPPPGGSEGSGDYNALYHKPRLNGVSIEGDHDASYYGIDQTYIHTQSAASDVWEIKHNLGRQPNVTVVDSAGTVVIGDVLYIDDDTITIHFAGAFSGSAYLN